MSKSSGNEFRHWPRSRDAPFPHWTRHTHAAHLLDGGAKLLTVRDTFDISWAELGRMVAASEGRQFKLEFRDLSDEL